MTGKVVMCSKCGTNFEDTDGEFDQLGVRPVCPECRAKANGKFARLSRAVSEKAGAAGQAIAETYKEIGASLLEKTGSLRQAASEKFLARHERKAQKKAQEQQHRAEEQQRKEEAETRRALLRKGVIITALPSLSCQVKKNLGYISANLYVELKKPDEAAITEIITTKEEELLDELRLKAQKLGANAIIGLNVSKAMSISKHRTGVLLSAYGTALEIAVRTKIQPQSPAQ